MTRRRHLAFLGSLLATVALVAACNGSSGPPATVPVNSSAPDASVVQGGPDVTPQSSDQPQDQPTTDPSGSTDGSPSPSQPPGTALVRAYFRLGGDPGSAGLVAVLRTITGTKAVATAAAMAVLAGPTAAETSRSISTAIPTGSQLLGLSVDRGVATVNLSSEFESGGGSASVLTRLGQVVYTLTQFPSVKSVQFQIDGQARSAFSSQGVALDKPVGRANYVQLLPPIWVDRPAFGAAAGNPAHVTGSADVFEATFRVAILDGGGKVLADQQAMASCGTGCRGTFDASVAYTLGKAQYGTLRVYEPSAKDGTPQNVRDYRVWLTPTS
jgi:spore germination protein GerM